MQETQVRSFGEEDGSPLQYSCLEKSMNRGAWQATVSSLYSSGGVASQRVGHDCDFCFRSFML